MEGFHVSGRGFFWERFLVIFVDVIVVRGFIFGGFGNG